MIRFSPIGDGTHWSGSDWSIADENELAVLIARVALGQYRHVIKVLQDTNSVAYAPTDTALEGAIRKLTATDPKNPWHRDGWLFQIVSWIAANIQQPETLKTPPHMIHADKGFDGLHLLLDANNENVVSVVVCEDKATSGPRRMVKNQVWPEFASLEAGMRDNELVAESTTLLAQSNHLDPDKAVHEILWKRSRAYRVAITVGDEHCSTDGKKALFKGYQEVAPGGSVNRRRAETLHRNNLREWMDRLAMKAIAAAKQLEAENV